MICSASGKSNRYKTFTCITNQGKGNFAHFLFKFDGIALDFTFIFFHGQKITLAVLEVLDIVANKLVLFIL